MRIIVSGRGAAAGRVSSRPPHSLGSGTGQLLADHAGRVLTRDQLLDIARGRAAEVFDRSIDVQVSRLRRKIEQDPKEPTLIKTVRSGGYIFSATVTRS